MTTAVILDRPYLCTSTPLVSEPVKHYVPLEDDICTDSTGVPSDEDLGTEPLAVVRFEHQVARFQRATGRERDAARAAIINKLLATDDPDAFLNTVIQTLTLSKRPGRLDDAVDILSKCGHLLPQFICEMLSQNQILPVDEDYWYVLIRSVGKSNLPAARMFVDLLWTKSREAAVEALGDIGDDESLKRLHDIAAGDPSARIRQLAAQAIEECSG